MRFATALGWSIIHFIWQGTLMAALFAMSQVMLRRRVANVGYVVGCFTMLLMLAAPLATLVGLATHASSSDGAVAAEAARGMNPSGIFPILTGIWLAGVILLSAWSAGGWVAAQRLRRQSRRRMPMEWQSRIKLLCVRVGIERTVRVFQFHAHRRADGLVGWLRPVILGRP